MEYIVWILIALIFVIMIIAVIYGFIINSRRNEIKKVNEEKNEIVVDSKMRGIIASKSIKKFIEDHPSYSEATVKEYFKIVSSNIMGRNEMDCFSSNVRSKILSDTKIEQIGKTQFISANLMSYTKKKYICLVTLSNMKEKYTMTIFGTINNNGFDIVEKYTIQREDV